ncbi:MAG: hypothetical protein SFU56_17185 [Capsulimonadales bacterium]|nr:hypothetical protein [Capsulimonadales bacterium]
MGLFVPQSGPLLWLFIVGALLFGGLCLFLLTLAPPRARKPLIAAVTFLAGLFFAAEFFWPVATSGDNIGKNFLTPYLKPVSDMTTVLQAFALGVGIYSLLNVHLRAIARRRQGWGFSVVLVGSILAIAVPALWKEYDRENTVARGLYTLAYDGGFNALNAAMFSIVAFYIVSAAYRAFRARSVEATILLCSALVVILGQIAVGQALTSWLPAEGFAANFRLEILRNWILTRVNAPAVLAIELGIGIGALATSLRLWLSLEQGSYFEEEV